MAALDEQRPLAAPQFAPQRPATVRESHSIAPPTRAVNAALEERYRAAVEQPTGFSRPATARPAMAKGRSGGAFMTTVPGSGHQADEDETAVSGSGTPRQRSPRGDDHGAAVFSAKTANRLAQAKHAPGRVFSKGDRGVVAPAKRVEALLDRYRSDPEERRQLEHRLRHYRRETAAMIREGRPLSARTAPPPAPPEPAADGAVSMSPRSSAAAAAASGAPLEEPERLDAARCWSWFERRMEARPKVELRPTPDEIRAHNAAREEAHRRSAIAAAAATRMRKEAATSNARREAHLMVAESERTAREEVQRAMQWATNVVLVLHAQRVWMRNAVVATLISNSLGVVRLRERVMRGWMAPAVANRRRAKARRARIYWYLAIAATRLTARLEERRRQTATIATYLRDALKLGRMCLAVRNFHRRIVTCQRAVRGYLEYRLWRLQLLHLQWDLAEDAHVRRIRGGDAQLAAQHTLIGLEATNESSPRRSARRARAASTKAAATHAKRVEKKTRAAELSSGMTDEEKVRVIVDADVRGGSFVRRTPFLFRHRAIVKFWTQARRTVARKRLLHERQFGPPAVENIRTPVPSTAPGSAAGAGPASPFAGSVSRRPRLLAVLQKQRSELQAEASVLAAAAPASGAFALPTSAGGLDMSVSALSAGSAGSPMGSPGIRTGASFVGQVDGAAPLPPGAPPEPRMPLLIPHERLDRLVLHALEEFAGICRQCAVDAARTVVQAKVDPAQYGVMRDSMIDAQFPDSHLQEKGFHHAAIIKNGALILSRYGAAARRTADDAEASMSRSQLGPAIRTRKARAPDASPARR